MATLYGYARVSTVEQDLSIQIARLKQAGCARIYHEKRNGSDKTRPQLTACLKALHAGDTLVITRIDRLARSMLHLCNLAADFAARGVHLKVLEQVIDTTSPTGKLQFHRLAAFAEFEKDLHKERQREGIARAKARGLYKGKSHTLGRSQIKALIAQRAAGVPIRELMRTFRLSKASVYRYLMQNPSHDADADGCAEPGVAYGGQAEAAD
jgi:DNA invertase Pin-like site-specific DNA recombinase